MNKCSTESPFTSIILSFELMKNNLSKILSMSIFFSYGVVVKPTNIPFEKCIYLVPEGVVTAYVFDNPTPPVTFIFPPIRTFPDIFNCVPARSVPTIAAVALIPPVTAMLVPTAEIPDSVAFHPNILFPDIEP